MTTPTHTAQTIISHPESLLHPQWAEVTDITPEAEGISTYWLRFTNPAEQNAFRFQPGQFNMVYLPGFGESAISISSDPDDHEKIGHTIRFVGNVTRGSESLESWRYCRRARTIRNLLAHERNGRQGCLHCLRRHWSSTHFARQFITSFAIAKNTAKSPCFTAHGLPVT